MGVELIVGTEMLISFKQDLCKITENLQGKVDKS